MQLTKKSGMIILMKKPITNRQKQLLSIIYGYIRDTGYPPSFEEMRERLKVSSNQSVLDLLEKLKQAGLIRRSETAARGITILRTGYDALGQPPLAAFLGMTSAGAPIQSFEISGEWKTLSKDIARLDENVFVLKVSGDSMINAGIDDGDAVFVQTKKEFVTREIVYAEINGEGTIKRFISEDKPPYVYLQPENPNYEKIVFTEAVELKGKVISILKNNQWVPAK